MNMHQRHKNKKCINFSVYKLSLCADSGIVNARFFWGGYPGALIFPRDQLQVCLFIQMIIALGDHFTLLIHQLPTSLVQWFAFGWQNSVHKDVNVLKGFKIGLSPESTTHTYKFSFGKLPSVVTQSPFKSFLLSSEEKVLGVQ